MFRKAIDKVNSVVARATTFATLKGMEANENAHKLVRRGGIIGACAATMMPVTDVFATGGDLENKINKAGKDIVKFIRNIAFVIAVVAASLYAIMYIVSRNKSKEAENIDGFIRVLKGLLLLALVTFVLAWVVDIVGGNKITHTNF